MIDRFPELSEKYYAETDWQEGSDTGSHVVYGDVFAPYVEMIIKQHNTECTKKIFMFIEEILSIEDKYSSEVIMFSVLERLMSDKEIFRNCKKYFGKNTEKIVKEMQKFF